MRIVALISLLFIITSCTGQIFSSDSIMAPRPFRMGSPPKDAHPDYLSGWNDGCDSGLSTMNPGYYKSFYSFKQDPYMASNARYYKAWKDAYTYCRQYSFRFVWEPFDAKRDMGNLCVLCPVKN